MKDISNILAAVDFSPNSANALKEAARMARHHGAKLHVAHIVTSDEVDEFKQFFDVTFESIKERGLDRIAAFVEEEAPGIEFEGHVLIGHPVHDLTAIIDDLGIEILVIGSRGTSEDDPHKLGMMASQCARKSPIPVLLVRRAHADPFTKVAACVDFSETARGALEAAAAVAEQDGATLSVVHVHYPPWLHPSHVLYDLQTTDSGEFREEYLQALKDTLAKFVDPVRKAYPDLKVEETVIEHTNVGYGIVGFLRSAGIDLAVVGSHGRSLLGRLLLGSNAERIVHQSPCSVLVTKPPAS